MGNIDFSHGTTSEACPQITTESKEVSGEPQHAKVWAEWQNTNFRKTNSSVPAQLFLIAETKISWSFNFSLLNARSVLGIVWRQIDHPINQAYLTSNSSSKNGVNHGSSLNVEWKLGLHTFQQILMHGINKGNKVFMCILLSPRPKAASPGWKVQGSL